MGELKINFESEVREVKAKSQVPVVSNSNLQVEKPPEVAVVMDMNLNSTP